MPVICELSYEQRLQQLELTTLEVRRIRGDLIEVYKIINNLSNIDPRLLFKFTSEVNPHDTRGHNFKIWPRQAPVNQTLTTHRLHSFSFRVRNIWNHLPKEVVNSETLNQLKNLLDAHIHRIGGTFTSQ